jgi:hypothetical protein
MNLELIRLKKKLIIMETEPSNQVFMDLLKSVGCVITSINEININKLKAFYKKEINQLEETELKYKQGKLL